MAVVPKETESAGNVGGADPAIPVSVPVDAARRMRSDHTFAIVAVAYLDRLERCRGIRVRFAARHGAIRVAESLRCVVRVGSHALLPAVGLGWCDDREFRYFPLDICVTLDRAPGG
jgi:hypothetical protein